MDEAVIVDTQCIVGINGIINKEHKTLANNETNTLPIEDKNLENPIHSNTEYTLPGVNLLLLQEL